MSEIRIREHFIKPFSRICAIGWRLLLLLQLVEVLSDFLLSLGWYHFFCTLFISFRVAVHAVTPCYDSRSRTSDDDVVKIDQRTFYLDKRTHLLFTRQIPRFCYPLSDATIVGLAGLVLHFKRTQFLYLLEFLGFLEFCVRGQTLEAFCFRLAQHNSPDSPLGCSAFALNISFLWLALFTEVSRLERVHAG